MSKINLNVEELEEIIARYNQLVDRREEQNKRLYMLLSKLDNVKSNGFVEEIVEKLERHIDDVNKVQIGNIYYNIDFLTDYIDTFVELDENILKGYTRLFNIRRIFKCFKKFFRKKNHINYQIIYIRR